MANKHIFISHASADDGFVRELRIKLELQGLTVWVDSRNLRGGDQLKPEIKQAIEEARHVLVVLSPKTINSAWVRDEIQMAEDVAKTKNKKNEDYRVIPLMLTGIEPAALKMWFKEEPVGEKINQLEVGNLQENLPHILAALGERLPDDRPASTAIKTKPVAELLLELSDPKLTQQEDGTFQISSKAELEYIPADNIQPSVKSRRFLFTSPIGQIELDDLRWYLEKYYLWPTGLFQDRTKEIEAKLPQWGKALYQAIFEQDECRTVIEGWNQATDNDRHFSVRIDAAVLGDNEDEQNNALEAASKLQSLPWELLHNGRDYLSGGANPVRVRRRLPNYENHDPVITQLPIRILLLSPRPEDEQTGYIDHRASAKPLADAVQSLGDLVELTVLTPPTLAALENALKRAKDNHQPYHVLHFDGHGVYDSKHGLGALCFEDPKDSHKLEQRAMQLVYAKYQQGNADSDRNIASLLHQYRIPLVFLEACQTAQTDIDPNASVAASLLEEGVVSVIAMSHSVLVESARRFVESFYKTLAEGQRVGQAMLEGQKTLMKDSYRLRILGAGDLHMQDWFVPILYQEKHDPQLFDRIPSSTAEQLSQKQQQTRLGKLPENPSHSFIGRSRELLTLERLLEQQPYAVIRGMGGIGKTTIAVELARWLLQTRRFDRCAFVSLEEYSHDRAVLDELGRQLVGKHYSVAEYGNDLDKAMQPIQRVLETERCLLVLDNMESLLADSENIDDVLSLINNLFPVGSLKRSASNQTDSTNTVGSAKLHQPYDNMSVIFTSRESLPTPFNSQQCEVGLGELNDTDAKALIMRVMAEQGLDLKHDDQGNTPEEVDALLSIVKGHARALVLLAKELAKQGITATTENLQTIMQTLEKEHQGERELSLFASVELSLQRLSADMREQIKGLAVLHDGGKVEVIAHILEIEAEEAKQLGAALIHVGLAEEKDYAYLRLDPALSYYLSRQLSPKEKQHYQQRWEEILSQLVDFLYKQRSKDAKLAAQLTQLEFANLMAFIRSLNQQMQAGQIEPEVLTDEAGVIEQLLAKLNYPQAMAEVVKIRQQASEQLGEWSSARFNTEVHNIERLLGQGDLQQADQKAQQLLQQAEQAGETAYSGADYDLAIAAFLLGRVLREAGAASEALPYLQQAQQRFEALGKRGEQMVSVCLAEQGDCLRALGQLEQAVTVYQENIRRGEKLADTRQVAVAKGQLATVYMNQKDYAAALQGHQEARQIFQQLNEPAMVATAYHQIGMLYRKQSQFEQAETAYRQALTIRVNNKLRANEAASLGELGLLYKNWNYPEQAVAYYRQAADIVTQLGNQADEGLYRNNLANTLIQLNRLDEARPELLRAIECKKSYGHAAKPWKTWNILHKLELSAGNPPAAQAAQQKAINTFLAYRRDGGENHDRAGRLALMVRQAIQQNDTAEIRQVIEQLLQQEDMQEHKTYLHSLQAIMAGKRDAALAEDDEMDYQLLVELKMLLEQL